MSRITGSVGAIPVKIGHLWRQDWRKFVNKQITRSENLPPTFCVRPLDLRGSSADIGDMSLPSGFLDELRTRLSLTQVVGRKVMWDNKKSNPGKGDMWAPCPFHQEKSASFHVDDRKGYYYCFGCHAKGDAISFVRETENVSFMEAIEILAREAGLPMPERDPRAQVKADHRTQLAEVMEEAVKFYRLQLRTGAAAEARAYLTKRGLSEAAQERWEIGFAPQGWQNLFDAMSAKGISPELLIGAGLAKPSDKGKAPYDVFRHRIMFPIRDVRGRAIAFGGRAMDPNDNAKYLNSPETDLFDKGRNLFNHKNAREASGKGQPLIVAEGYMDVIALSEAGFTGAVAPLGTAVTDHQLQLMWRMADEPIIALDGDTAGIRAAMRVIDLALPVLEAGKSLRFGVMPDGMDPDDLIRSKGAGAVQKVLDGAMPMVRLLWQRETDGKIFDSPERRAALDKSLREKIKLIQDPSIRHHYGEAIKELRYELFGSNRRPAYQPRRPWQPGKSVVIAPSASAKRSELVQRDDQQIQLRETVILAILIANPTEVPAFEMQLERMECQDQRNRTLRDAILRLVGEDDLRDRIEDQIGSGPLESLFAERQVVITPAIRRAGDSEFAYNSVKEEFMKLEALRGHSMEILEAQVEIAEAEDREDLTWRLGVSALAVDPTTQRDVDDTTETVTADNGLSLSKDERNDFLKVLESLDPAKSGRKKPRT